MATKKAKAEKTANLIKEVSKRHFLKNGFKDTYLIDIAKEIKIDRRTIYRHFESKEILILELVYDVYNDFAMYLQEVDFSECNEALSKIGNLFDKYYDYMKKNPEFLTITSMLDRNLSIETRNVIEHDKYIKSVEIPDLILMDLLKEGKVDKSIKPNIDANIVAVTINNSLLSLASRIASHKDHLDMEQSLDSWIMLETQAKLFLHAIKNLIV